ncbi:dTDP-4-dehydrorhamnose 3,5-epimerase [Streptomyces sp. 2MCAF27]
MTSLSIEGAWEIKPEQFSDERGIFMEWYRYDRLAEIVGHPLQLAQANMSVSAKDVVRGIHFTDFPPGQGKYVTCVRGASLDVIVDLRVGSPTFGTWEAVRLDDIDRKAVYISEGLGHAFCALSDEATVAYLCSETYASRRERAIDPLDPVLGIEWPVKTPILSGRDKIAPSFAEAAASGLLPDHRACREFAAGNAREFSLRST